MKYYFDESGNWQEIQNENRKLVIGGVLIKDENYHIELNEEFKWFMAENRLKYILNLQKILYFFYQPKVLLFDGTSEYELNQNLF